jgi:hypothetical protein
VSLAGWLKQTERRFAWSLLGTVIGATGIYLAIVALHEKRPQVTFATLSEVNVFDVHAPVQNLNILFQGQNVQQQDMNLRILTVKIENTGEVDVLENYFDSRLQWGFSVKPGRVIEARLVSSNDPYLRSQLRPSVSGDSIILTKPILERGKYVTLDVLVLHPRQVIPTIVPFGKIAGIDRFGIVRASPNTADRRPLWIQTLEGSPAVQAFRAVIYPILLVLVGFGIFGVASFISWIGERRAKRKRALRVRPFLAFSAHDWEKRKFFADVYVDGGLTLLTIAQRLLGKEALLRNRLRVLRASRHSVQNWFVTGGEFTSDGLLSDQLARNQVLRDYRLGDPEYKLAKRMLDAGLVALEKDRKVHVTAGTLEALSELFAYLSGNRIEPPASGLGA